MSKALLWSVVIGVLVVIVGGFLLFSSSDSNGDEGSSLDTSNSQANLETNDVPTTTDTTGSNTNQDTSATTQETKEFTIRESNFKLSPSTIQVNKGDNVKITVIVDGGTHNLFVEGYNERVEIVSSGNTQVIEFIADKEGIFNMWCEVGNHRQLGLEGQITVT